MKMSAIEPSMNASPSRSVVESMNAPNVVARFDRRASAPSRMSRIDPMMKSAAPSQKNRISLRYSK